MFQSGGGGGYGQWAPPATPGAFGFPAVWRPPPRLEEVRSLWIGEVQNEWTEEFVEALFGECGKKFKVKLMKDRPTGGAAGYGFLEFETHADAEEVLAKYSDQPIKGTGLRLNLRWGGGHGRQRSVAPATLAPDCSIFVGDLDYSVTEAQLHEAFATRYRSAVASKLVMDLATGTSKGFGFVKFSDAAERDRAVMEMNGQYVGDRQIRCTIATTRDEREKPVFDPSRLLLPKATEEGENTCVFVGGLDESVTPDMLRHHFGLLGDIAYIRIPPGRGCGFVGFVHRKNAEAAISTLQGLRINGYKVRLSWGSMRQGPKTARPAQVVRPGAAVLPTAAPPVRKEVKTPFGALTNDFCADLPEPRQPWAKHPNDQPAPKLEEEEEEEEEGVPPVPPRLATKAATVPMSPYVAQLKARYEAYVAAAAKPSPRTATSDIPGDRYSFYSTRTSRPAKRPMTEDEVHVDNHNFVHKFLKKTLALLASGVVLPLPAPRPLAAHYDHAADTPMAAYVASEGG
ncbi:hypothetical protein CTAYLR_002538 [Chrysophaeum taylorii]|uniref:RRM domain-containing protein n=1 Tax=Chrysophaeum taylorii TaxID=2483200 RepID=A0AAD7UFN6_9STRA|nr:hypothetical protein CTAYLR_002538 [Chrysophaeum taylorii]